MLFSLSTFIAISSVLSLGQGFAIPSAHEQQVLLSCESVMDTENQGFPVEVGSRDRDPMKISRSGKDVSHISLLDRYFGPFLDTEGGASISSSFNGKEKSVSPPEDDALHAFMLNDEYEYPHRDDLRDINGTNTLYRGGEFAGITTFAHLPYANCYNPKFFDKEKYDIAIVGAPYDSGTSYRPGARFGPSGIRMGSRRLAPAYSVYKKGFNPYKNWAKIVDCGDPPVTTLDNRIALDQIYRANRAIAQHKTSSEKLKAPKVFTLGGDHTITLPAIKAAYEKWGPITVIHIDSHLDTWNPYYFGGNVTDYQSVNHGTYLHWAHEKGLLTDRSIHAAIRGPYPGPKDVEHDEHCGFDRVLARDMDTIGIDGIIEKIKNRVGSGPVYITVDVDSLDPAYTPASGTVEPGGWTSREILSVLDGLEGLDVVGGDVVEVAPPYDTNAEVTSITAAQIADSIISLMILREEEGKEGKEEKEAEQE